jgi:ribosome biogenesis GTPase
MSLSSLLLEDLGWDPAWQQSLAAFAAPDLVPARVIVAHRGLYRLYAATGEVWAELSGSLRHSACTAAEVPTTGDWVAVRLNGVSGGLIQHVLPRRSKFSRKVAGNRTSEQLLGANIDIVFVVMGLDHDFSVRRVERYVVTAWEGGATPVIVLNKADLCDAQDERRLEVERAASGVDVHVISAIDPGTLPALRKYLVRGSTIAVVGSSGAGKSTLINALFGAEIQQTRTVRLSDSKGRHTTTRRELILLPGGGLLLDTPGMRELQLWSSSENLAGAFSDIDGLAVRCRFRDCTHLHEPGCAVRGGVDADRLSSFHRLQRELRSLEIRSDARATAMEKRKWKTIHKTMRRHPKGRD